jgi:transcriptional regulator with XRE-family HTH domain
MNAKSRRPPLLQLVENKRRVLRFEKQDFARNLYALMNERGMSKSDLARKIWGDIQNRNGTKAARNRERIGSYLRCETYPEPATLKLIANALEVSVDEIAPRVLSAPAGDREQLELSVTVVSGHPDRVFISLNTTTSLSIAAQIMELFRKSKADNKRDEDEDEAADEDRNPAAAGMQA